MIQNRPQILVALAILACLGLLGIATIGDILEGADGPRQEFEARTPAPPTSPGGVRAFPGDIRFYLKRRYAGKSAFVHLNGTFKATVFGHAAAPDVVMGQNGVLFLAEAPAVAMWQGENRMSPAQSLSWQRAFALVDDHLSSNGVPFAFVLAPDKARILGDDLPDWLQKTRSRGTIRSDDLLSAAEAVLGPRAPRLRRVLAQARHGPTYHRNDTHWTEIGAEIAMRATLEPLGVDIPDGTQAARTAPHAGDLSRMAGQGRVDPAMPVYDADVSWSCADPDGAPLRVETIDPLMPARFTCSGDGADPRRLVAFVDSFGIPAIPVLASTFASVAFIQSDRVDPALALSSGADLVLQILVERKAATLDPP